ncbi:hypothetical protein P7C71_g5807, partial [Lecanoromycetidae sp. Uapishka_2]
MRPSSLLLLFPFFLTFAYAAPQFDIRDAAPAAPIEARDPAPVPAPEPVPEPVPAPAPEPSSGGGGKDTPAKSPKKTAASPKQTG